MFAVFYVTVLKNYLILRHVCSVLVDIVYCCYSVLLYFEN